MKKDTYFDIGNEKGIYIWTYIVVAFNKTYYCSNFKLFLILLALPAAGDGP